MIRFLLWDWMGGITAFRRAFQELGIGMAMITQRRHLGWVYGTTDQAQGSWSFRRLLQVGSVKIVVSFKDPGMSTIDSKKRELRVMMGGV